MIAAEEPALAAELFDVVMSVAERDADPFARAMAIGAIVGFKTTRIESEDPESMSYADPDERPKIRDRFDAAFPAWARDSGRFRDLLVSLSDRNNQVQVREAALRARAWLADDESLRHFWNLLSDKTESARVRQVATEVLYRSRTEEAYRYLRELADGKVPGLPDGHRIRALRELIAAGRHEDRHESVVIAMATSNDSGFGEKKTAIRLLTVLYGKTKSQAAFDRLSRGLREPDVGLRVRYAEAVRKLGDTAFLASLQQAKAEEGNPVAMEYLNAAINRVDPTGERTPTIIERLEELDRLSSDAELPVRERLLYGEQYQALREQWLRFCREHGR